jgi:SNF2 family DNA or RNA helicase
VQEISKSMIYTNLPGMGSSLLNYQLLGASFLSKREASKQRPYGGILDDHMGLGKRMASLLVHH